VTCNEASCAGRCILYTAQDTHYLVLSYKNNNGRYHANKHIGLKLIYVLPSAATNFVVAEYSRRVNFNII